MLLLARQSARARECQSRLLRCMSSQVGKGQTTVRQSADGHQCCLKFSCRPCWLDCSCEVFTLTDRLFRQHKHWDWKPVEPLIKLLSQILSHHYTFPLTDNPMGHWFHSSKTGSVQFLQWDDMFYFLLLPPCSLGLFHGSMMTSTVWNCLVSSLGVKKVGL